MPGKNIDSYQTLDDGMPKTVHVGNFQNRSEAAQEIISRRPGFTEKWALFLFLGILAALFGATWFIRYPDIVQTRATLTSRNGPKDIVAFQSGALASLFVGNGQHIDSGATIAYIESAADAGQVMSLSRQLGRADNLLFGNKLKEMSNLFGERYGRLGEVQSAYQTFVSALQQFNDYYVNGFYGRKKAMLGSDLSTLDKMGNALDEQRGLAEKDNRLAEENHKMNESLYREKIISAEEYRQDQSQLLNRQMGLPQVNSSILSNQNQKRDKLKELEQLDHDLAQQRVLLEQALQTLKSTIDAWIKQYVLIAPVDGTLYLTRPLQHAQYVQSGKTIGYVAPTDDRLFAELYLPQNNLGKVDTGMQVQLRFDAYPYQEKGIVKGSLDYMSRVVSDSGYLGIVGLDKGLVTNQHITLPYKDGLKADALIVTKDMSLFERLYYRIVKGISITK
ncbi:MAG: HlyD family efflux transporter periplasmic adaptor subunit [Chitinophagaceae bacterium]